LNTACEKLLYCTFLCLGPIPHPVISSAKFVIYACICICSFP